MTTLPLVYSCAFCHADVAPREHRHVSTMTQFPDLETVAPGYEQPSVAFAAALRVAVETHRDVGPPPHSAEHDVTDEDGDTVLCPRCAAGVMADAERRARYPLASLALLETVARLTEHNAAIAMNRLHETVSRAPTVAGPVQRAVLMGDIAEQTLTLWRLQDAETKTAADLESRRHVEGY